ncbi:MAG: PEGA domain-containing protein [bacterium]|nr:PEGA domain-containing protein [bacterium]
MSAFEKSTRRKIFYGMVLLFALIVPLALLYSRGYVPDFNRRGFVATGGIFVKTAQPGARVFIDGEFSKETSFILHGALITNLLPKRYTVRVEKAGYQSWSKAVRVTDEEVLEFRNVLLPRSDIRPAALYTGRLKTPIRAVPLAGRSELALETGDPSRPISLVILDPRSGRRMGEYGAVSRWDWDENSGALIIGRKSGGGMRWSRVPLAPGGAAAEERIDFRGLPPGFFADRVIPHPTEVGQFYFSAGGALFLQGRSSVPIAIAEQVHAYAASREHLYFITRNGFFAESNLVGGDAKLLGRKGLLLDEGSPARILIGPDGDVAVFDAANGLFLYRPGRSTELELVAGGITGADFSASGDRLLIWDERHLWVYWLKDNPAQPFDLAGTKKQIFTTDVPIRRAYLNTAGTHAFYSTDQGIRMVEVDDRANVNSYDLVTASVGSFAMDRNDLTLYWFEIPTLYRASVR